MGQKNSDTVRDSTRPEIAVELLLLENNLPASKPGYYELAVRLSAAVGRDSNWSWQYVRGIHKANGKIEAGKKMRKALQILLASLDDVPALIAGSDEVMVLQPPGSDIAGAMIYGQKRRCANPKCANLFVPNTAKRKICYVCVKVRRRRS